MVFDSSGGFRLDDGSVLSPDAAVPYAARWPPTWPTAPGWAGCCLPNCEIWRSGGPVAPQMLQANPCGLTGAGVGGRGVAAGVTAGAGGDLE